MSCPLEKRARHVARGECMTHAPSSSVKHVKYILKQSMTNSIDNQIYLTSAVKQVKYIINQSMTSSIDNQIDLTCVVKHV